MDRVFTLQAFVLVAEEKSFAAAARRLNVSAPVITRAVAELESRIGVKLLDRTTRNVKPTEAGMRYVEDVKTILEDLEIADEAAAGINAEPRGMLNVTASVLFGRMFVLPGIQEYLNRFPETQVSALFLDRVVNLLEEGIDVAVRIGNLPDSSLHAVKVGEVGVLCLASPDYIDRNGAPNTPEELNNHSTIVSNAAGGFFDWKFINANYTRNIKLKTRLTVSNNESVIDAALDGFGITRLLSYQVAPHIEDGSLVRILQDYESPTMPVSIVFRDSSRFVSARVRSFVDLMKDYLGSSLSSRQSCIYGDDLKT